MKHPVPPAAVEAIRSALVHLGIDVDGDGVQQTPRRFAHALLEMTSGLREPPEEVARILAVDFEAAGYDALATVRRIPFVSLCEHHLMPFTGLVSIAYLPALVAGPGGAPQLRVLGLSKLPRLVDVFAARPQLQERMTAQIADAIVEHVQPRGVAVTACATHDCLRCRGARKDGVLFVTRVLRGLCDTNSGLRAEAIEDTRL